MNHGKFQSPILYQDVLDASERLAAFLPPSPLRNYPTLDREVGCTVLVKQENWQPTGAFKIRNAFSALSRLVEQGETQGIVAATRGNHGIGLALAGKQLGIPVTICVPTDNSEAKNVAIQSYGAELIVAGENYDEAIAYSLEFAQRERRTLIHATNNRDVLAGAGTITTEVLAQSAQLGYSIDAMFFAVGGGSQAVGALTVLNARGLSIPVIGVQAAGAPAFYDSFHAGEPRTAAVKPTVADGIATGQTYDMTFDALRTGLCDMRKVSEEVIADSLRLVIGTTHNLVEGAAVVGLAGLRQLGKAYRGKTVMVVFTGANIDWDVLRRIVQTRTPEGRERT